MHLTKAEGLPQNGFQPK